MDAAIVDTFVSAKGTFGYGLALEYVARHNAPLGGRSEALAMAEGLSDTQKAFVQIGVRRWDCMNLSNTKDVGYIAVTITTSTIKITNNAVAHTTTAQRSTFPPRRRNRNVLPGGAKGKGPLPLSRRRKEKAATQENRKAAGRRHRRCGKKPPPPM